MMTISQITDCIKQLFEQYQNNISPTHLLIFFRKCYPDIILTDGNGSGGGNHFDSFKILNSFNAQMNFPTENARRNFLKKIRLAIESHNMEVGNKRLNRIKELEQSLKKKEKIISTCKEDLLLDIILNKNPEKYLYDLVFKYDLDRKYKQKILILEYMIEKRIDTELAFLEIINHFLEKEQDYEKCKKYGLLALVDFDNINILGLMVKNEFEYDDFDEMKKYFNLLVDKIDSTKAINPEWDILSLTSYYIVKHILNNNDEYKPCIAKLLSVINCKDLRNDIIENIYYSLEDYKNYIEQYNIFKDLGCSNNEIPKDVINDSSVVKYINKCNLMFNMGDCCICLNDNIKCIPLECCHYFCTNCYPMVVNGNTCPTCRCEI